VRVLFVTSALRRGGAERQWRTLVPALRDSGMSVELLTLRGRGEFFDEIAACGVPAHCAELRSRYDVVRIARALRRADRPDAIVAQGVDAVMVAALLSLRTGARLVVVEHGGVSLSRRPHRRLLTRLASRRVDRLVVVSPSQLTALRDIGYATNNAVVITNGVEPVKPEHHRAEVRSALAVGPDAFVVSFVGGLRLPKRPQAFAAALAAPALAALGVHGLVVGDGPLRPAVESEARAAAGRVHVLGERRDVDDLLAASDAACLVSDTEALPMAILEAMSAGLPVIASNVGGIPDAVVDGETGILVEGGDDEALAAALAALASDRARSSSLGAAGRERYEQMFSAGRMVGEYAALLTEAVE
jgi:glycosyltransferase involved in cell wall biosynthesis